MSFEPLQDSALDSWVEELIGAGLLVESQEHVRILTGEDRPFDIAALVCRDRGQSLSAHGDDFESPIAQHPGEGPDRQTQDPTRILAPAGTAA